jgi:SAM-dependent methyltransferase
MQEERNRWNARYGEIREDGIEPDPYLVEAHNRFVSPLFPRQGHALDVAGGAGRHAIWLARQGWNTTLLDISPVALESARKRSGEERLSLHFVEADLDDYSLPEDAFDLIAVFYFLQRTLFPSLQRSLRAGGIVIYKTLMLSTVEETAAEKPNYRLHPGELPHIFSGFEILDSRTETGSRGCVAALTARKP